MFFVIHTFWTIIKQSGYWSCYSLLYLTFICCVFIDSHRPINITLSKGHRALRSISWFGFISWVTMGNKTKCISPLSIPLSGPDVAHWPPAWGFTDCLFTARRILHSSFGVPHGRQIVTNVKWNMKEIALLIHQKKLWYVNVP